MSKDSIVEKETRAREALVHNGTNFKLLVDSVRDYAIYMLDPAGRVISWNTGAERIKGYEAAEVIGRHFSLFYLPEEVTDGRPEHELFVATEMGRYEEEGWRVRKDGSRFRAHVVLTPLYESDGRLSGFAKVTRDYTEQWVAQRALRESEERFRVLVEQIQEYAIFMLDPQGHISTWNSGAQRIKGYAAREVLGKPLSTFYTPEDRASGKTRKLLHEAEQMGIAHDVGWRVRKDGSRFWADISLTALRLPSGELYGFAKVVRDLTERVEAEDQRQAYEAAKEAIQIRDEFLSIASHELRTPLTALQLQLQSLQRLSARDPDEWKHDRITSGIATSFNSTKRISDLIETLLDVSRIATNRIRLKLDDFDLVETCRDAATYLQQMIDESGCAIRFVLPDAPINGRWDRLRIEQALMNLISNACKYAPNSTIEIGAEADDQQVRIWVSDTGHGIAETHIDRIFGRFERAVPSSNYGGLGLGLYVTQQIVDIHGGRVEVSSEHGKGSTFILLLPMQTQIDDTE